MRPVPSPQPPMQVSETPTGEYPAASEMPAPARATPAYVDAALEGWFGWFKKWAVRGGALATLLGGGAITASHYSATGHADKAVNERTAALEARHEETKRRLDALELKVDDLRDQQLDSESAAERRQAELLEAIKGKHR